MLPAPVVIPTVVLSNFKKKRAGHRKACGGPGVTANHQNKKVRDRRIMIHIALDKMQNFYQPHECFFGNGSECNMHSQRVWLDPAP